MAKGPSKKQPRRKPIVSGVLKRLQTDASAIEGLGTLVASQLLETQVSDLVDAPWIGQLIADGLRGAVTVNGFEERLAQRLEDTVANAAVPEGSLHPKHWPDPVVDAIKDGLRRPVVIDPELLRALMDHRSVRRLVREVMADALTRFARHLRSALPTTSGSGRRRGRISKVVGVAQGVAQGVAGAVAGEVERQMEGRVREFVDDALGRAVDRTVSMLSGRDGAAELGAMRVHVLDVLLQRPHEQWQADAQGALEAGLAADIASLLEALAAWDGLAEEISAVIEEAISIGGQGMTLGELLQEVPVEEGWPARLSGPLVARARDVVTTKAFEDWLEDLLENPSS